MRSPRQLRVGEEIRHALAMLFQRDEIPWPSGQSPGMLTVSEVQVSPDLKNATVFVLPLGGRQVPETVRLLNEMVKFFRHEVAEAIQLRYAPRLYFKADTSFEYANKIETLLASPEVARSLHKKPERDDEP